MQAIKRKKLIYQETGDPIHVLQTLEAVEQMPGLSPDDQKLCCDVWATLLEHNNNPTRSLPVVEYMVNLGRLLERRGDNARKTKCPDFQ